jgi:CRP-like cAMP-binding protein
MGDAWARNGKTEKAIGAYQSAAEGFAREGFLPRAIAASKLVLELDPAHKEVQRMLAALYARKSAPASKVPVLPAAAEREPKKSVLASPGAPSASAKAKRAEKEWTLELPKEEGSTLLQAVEREARIGLAERAKAVPMETGKESKAASPGARRRVPKVPLFSDLPAEAFIDLFERGPILRFKKSQLVFRQGSVGEAFYVVCQGEVKVSREQRGRRQELAVLGEGSFFGEMALLSDNPRAASVESTSDETELLEISAKLLADLSRRYPSVAEALRTFCRQRLLSNLMEASALFRPFTLEERRVLVEKFLPKEVQRGAVIIREGEEADGLYVILSGEVRVAKGSQLLARLKEGEIFGEMSLLTKAAATATVVATRRTSLLRLPRKDFDELIMSHPQILVLVSELTEDRRGLTQALLSDSAARGKEFPLLV